MDAISAIGGTYATFSAAALVITSILITDWIMYKTTDEIRDSNPFWKSKRIEEVILTLKQRLSFSRLFLMEDRVSDIENQFKADQLKKDRKI